MHDEWRLLCVTRDLLSDSISSRVQYGSGTLFLTTENIMWISASDPEKALSFHWRSMLMHAISRDTSSFPHACIYCQVEFFVFVSVSVSVSVSVYVCVGGFVCVRLLCVRACVSECVFVCVCL